MMSNDFFSQFRRLRDGRDCRFVCLDTVLADTRELDEDELLVLDG